MAPENESTVTFVISDELKREVRQAAEAEGSTITGFVRDALRERLAPRTRAFVPPAFTERFDALLDRASVSKSKHRDHEIIFLIEDRRGRSLVRGTLALDHMSDSMIGVRPFATGKPFFVPRVFVVGWFDAPLNEDAITPYQWSLLEQGWRPGPGVRHDGVTVRQLLEEFHGEPSTPTKVARRLRLPQPTVVRVLEWLAQFGVVRTVAMVEERHGREATWGVAVPGGSAMLFDFARSRGLPLDTIIEVRDDEGMD